jgi:acylphosphatase
MHGNRQPGVKRASVILTFSGALVADSFLAFVRHRADRLELPFAVLASDDTAVAVAVDGQADLVDAFDMACSLGPRDCIVLDVTRAPAPSALFESRNERP